jgi:hypothetical protein
VVSGRGREGSGRGWREERGMFEEDLWPLKAPEMVRLRWRRSDLEEEEEEEGEGGEGGGGCLEEERVGERVGEGEWEITRLKSTLADFRSSDLPPPSFAED